jgi:hypothetical protein
LNHSTSAHSPHETFGAVSHGVSRFDAALENPSFAAMRFEHHVVADVVGGQEVDAVLIAAVDDDICPVAIEKLEER